MRSNNSDAIKAIDPKYEQWVAVSWTNYQTVKDTIDTVHGVAFYALEN